MIEKLGRQCCGCSACANACPKSCITMRENEEGFLYPQVQQELCVHCGLCEKACPILCPPQPEEAACREAWGVTCKDQALLLDSSSGGLFSLLAEEVLRQGGCVFGAAFSGDFEKVKHIKVTTPTEMGALRGSKYVQSDMNTCYRQAKQELLSGRTVLFSGTPCQIAGLKAYLGQPCEKLICADIICHGVPSPALWRAYLRQLEKQLGGNADFVSFRSKKNGWQKYGLLVQCGAQSYFQGRMQEPYLKIFIRNYCLRESCFQCFAKGSNSPSDITIGDFWGVGRIAPDLNNELGVSLALLHTEKGRALFSQVLPKLSAGRLDYGAAVRRNSAFSRSVRRPKERDLFFSDFHSLAWDEIAKKYGRDNLKIRVRRVLGKIKRKILS